MEKQLTEGGVTYSTGAVRSGDAEDCRYDLVSPIAVNRLKTLFEREVALAGNNVASTLDYCLCFMYIYLSGERYGFPLEFATSSLFIAIEQDLGRATLSRCTMSPDGLRVVAETCHEGAIKYSDHNWEKGMPISDLLNHAIRHIVLFKSGDRSESHLGHAAWNLFAAMHSEELWPHLNQNLRQPGCKPPKPQLADAKDKT